MTKSEVNKTVRRVLMPVVLVAIIVFCGTACSDSQNNAVRHTYNDNLPSQFVLTGDAGSPTYNMIIADYYNRSYSKIATGTALDEMEIIYDASYSSEEQWYINKIAASDRYIAWGEYKNASDDSEHYIIKNYDRETKEIVIVAEVIPPKGEVWHQVFDMGFVGNTLYYLLSDYESNSCKIVSKDFANNTETVVVEYPFLDDDFPGNLPISFLKVKDSLLICNNKFDGITYLEVHQSQTGELIRSTALPDYAEFVFGADYEPDADVFAVYFMKNKETPYGFGDGLAVIKAGDSEVKEFYTMGEHTLLYRDKISIHGDIVYCVMQSNVSGMVIDHYQGVMYNYETDKPKETERCFYLNNFGDDLYGLVFGSKSEKVVTFELITSM